MCRKNLKNYHLYLDKLERYAEGIQITVVRKEENGEGVYIPTKRLIRLDPDLEQVEEIATFLHELGHAIDDHFINDKVNPKLERAYRTVYHGKPTSKQVSAVVECEQRAWDNGRKIARILRIPLGVWYTDEEKRCIALYKATEK